jgi:hypothetical protein
MKNKSGTANTRNDMKDIPRYIDLCREKTPIYEGLGGYSPINL